MDESDYPALYQSASNLSQTAQKAFYNAFLGHMVLLTIAAAISVINSSNKPLAILQAMVLLGALGCALHLYLVKPDKEWYAARAVAESVKTITWRYISKAEPFNGADADDNNKFSEKLASIVNQNRDVASKLVSHLQADQITTKMATLRKSTLAERIKLYYEYRIVDQQQWYAKKAQTNKVKVNAYFLALIVIILAAMFFAIAKIEYSSAPYWPTDLFVTIAAGLLSWIQAKKFQELSASYALTAHEISLIKHAAVQNMTPDQFSNFVGDTENAFSREHTQWVARKDS